MKQTPAYTIFNRELLALMPEKARQVVEIGCMLGNFAQAYRQINPECHYTGIDIDADYAHEAKKHCDVAIAADVDVSMTACGHNWKKPTAGSLATRLSIFVTHGKSCVESTKT